MNPQWVGQEVLFFWLVVAAILLSLHFWIAGSFALIAALITFFTI